MFLGASYFRALGTDQRYGLSARGLAIDTGARLGRGVPALRRSSGSSGRRPTAKRAGDLRPARLAAASPAPTASWCSPGTRPVVDVKARLFLRGERRPSSASRRSPACSSSARTSAPPLEDYRPEVHDSDGLSIQLGTGEWLWRPLVNPTRLLVTSFALSQPARLRPACSATATSPATRTSRRATSCARAPGSSRRALGRRARRAGADPDARRDQRQHRRLLGARASRRAPGKPLDFEYRVLLAEGRRDAPAARVGRADAPRPRLPAQARRQHRLRRRLRRAGAAEAAAGGARSRRC